MTNETTACFTGHRGLDSALLPALTAALERAIAAAAMEGVTDFFSGGAMGFDLLAGEAVLTVKQRYPHILLHLAIPYAGHCRLWSKACQEQYHALAARADSVTVLSPFYYNGCMMVRNRYMVDRSSRLICYYANKKGGTANTIGYAASQELSICNLALLL